MTLRECSNNYTNYLPTFITSAVLRRASSWFILDHTPICRHSGCCGSGESHTPHR